MMTFFALLWLSAKLVPYQASKQSMCVHIRCCRLPYTIPVFIIRLFIYWMLILYYYRRYPGERNAEHKKRSVPLHPDGCSKVPFSWCYRSRKKLQKLKTLWEGGHSNVNQEISLSVRT